MSSEHVEVLRRMRNEWPLATDEGPALDAAIASLSAPQPPAEAQPASDGGFSAADMMDARQEGRKEAQQSAAVDVCLHEWLIWPETDGFEQRCSRCGSHRPTPKADRDAALAAQQGGRSDD